MNRLIVSVGRLILAISLLSIACITALGQVVGKIAPRHQLAALSQIQDRPVNGAIQHLILLDLHRQLAVTLPVEPNIAHLSWSADGERLQFVSKRANQTLFYTLHAGRLQIHAQNYENSAYFIWSPNGENFVYAQAEYVDNQPAMHLYLSNLHTHRRLTDLTQGHIPIAWSPDSTQLAYLQSTPYGIDEIMLLDVNTSQKRHLVTAASEPVWSKDGTQLAVVTSRGVGSFPSIAVIDMQTGQQQPVIDDNVHNTMPTWSPNGQRIAFVRNNDIYMINTDGSTLRQLADNDPSTIDFMPVWAARGQSVAYLSIQNGWQVDLYLIDNVNQPIPRRLYGDVFSTPPVWRP